MSVSDRDILEYIETKGTVTTKDVSEEFSISKDYTRRKMGSLLKFGFVTCDEELTKYGKTNHYSLAVV